MPTHIYPSSIGGEQNIDNIASELMDNERALEKEQDQEDAEKF